jgi:hypothetical protein
MVAGNRGIELNFRADHFGRPVKEDEKNNHLILLNKINIKSVLESPGRKREYNPILPAECDFLSYGLPVSNRIFTNL